MQQTSESTVSVYKLQPRFRINGRVAILVASCGLLLVYVFSQMRNQYRNADDVLLDAAWFMSLAATWNQGEILGRDIYFTYGPLSQWIASLGSNLVWSKSAFDGIALSTLTFEVISILAITIAIALMGLKQWQQNFVAFWALCLVLSKEFQTIIRFLLPIIGAALLAYAMRAEKRSTRLLSAFFLGIASLLCQLLSADLGVYMAATSVVVLGLYALYAWVRGYRHGKTLPAKEYMGMLCVFVSAFVVANIVVSLLFLWTSPTYASLFEYQKRTLEMIQGYNYTMAAPWGYSVVETLVLLGILLFALGFVAIRVWSLNGPEQTLLVALSVCAMFMLKSALIRSDTWHIAWGSTGLSYLFILVGVKYFGELGIARFIWVLLLLGTMSWSTGNGWVVRRVPIMVSQLLSPRQTYLNAISSRVVPQDLLPAELLEMADPNKGMLNFPFENEIAIGLGRRLVAPILQTYAATSVGLQEFYISELDKQKEKTEILYALDNLRTARIDKVSQVTRVPIIFEYIYRNFDAKLPEVNGYILLEARPSQRSDMRFEAVDLATSLQRESNTLSLVEPIACSFLKLNLDISYPLTSLLGRPNPLHIIVSHAGQEVAANNLVRLDAGTFSVYIDLLQPNEFGTLFGPNAVAQHQIDGFTLNSLPTGIFGVDPKSVVIKSVECVTFQR